ncbi:acyltransferase PGAP2-like [Lampetra planeri]
MLQGSNIFGHERPLVIRLSFSTCVLGTVCLPLIGLITCISISYVFHFDDCTGTHCQVPNYLPSISASIGLSPECHIWRICIGLHSAPRLLVAFTYFNLLNCLNLAFALIENLGLLLLTYVSSIETYFVHKEGFILFLVGSLFHMLITCRLWKAITKYSVCPEDLKSHLWKVRSLLLYVCFCVFAGFFYWKHNMYCESGSYTLFALFEYLVVFSNMAFHLTAIWDFRSRQVMVISCSEDKDF